jgi:C1A family cysteine protease
MSKLVKLLIAVSLVLNLFVVVASAEVIQKDTRFIIINGMRDHFTGLKMETEEELLNYNHAEKFVPIMRLPAMVDLSNELPTPGNQGSQESCVAWATAYDYKSFQERTVQHWSDSTPNHQFSPAYVYNQIDGGKDDGSNFGTAFNLLVSQGCATLTEMPYNDKDYTTQPNEKQKQEAAHYKSVSWACLEAGNVEQMKTHLAAGDVIVVCIPVYHDFDDLNANNPIYDTITGNSRGNHAICFVGYDDSKQAFKLINSWGTGWGLGGYGYMSYNLVEQLKTQGFVMTEPSEFIKFTPHEINNKLIF